jgi:hypothetical protein
VISLGTSLSQPPLKVPNILSGAKSTQDFLAVIRKEEELRDLFLHEKDCPARSIFQTQTWMETWWDSYRNGKTVCAGKVMREGRPVALFPLFVKNLSYFGTYQYREMRIVGTGEKVATDFHDFLAYPGYEDTELATQFFSFLVNTREDWDEVNLAEFEEESKIYKAIVRNAAMIPFSWVLEKSEECPYQDLPGTGEQYIRDLLSRRVRKTLINRRNHLHKKYKVRFEINSEDGDLQQRMKEIEAIHQARWTGKGEEGIFGDPQKAKFIHSVVEQMEEKGNLFLGALLLDSDLAAAEISFLRDGVLYLYQAGMNPKYRAAGVGRICTLLTIEAAISRKTTRVEMLRGQEEYKSHFAKCSRSTYRLRIFNNNVRGKFQWLCKKTGAEYIFRKTASLLDDLGNRFARTGRKRIPAEYPDSNSNGVEEGQGTSKQTPGRE